VKAWLAILVVVLFCGAVQAQPQAPITWGTARLLMNAPVGINIYNGIFAHGDTLILAGFESYPGGRRFATLSVSGDNGQTFSPWHTFVTPDSMDSWETFAVTSSGIYCCAPVSQPFRGIFRSTDLGQTWTGPTTTLPFLQIKAVRGDTIWTVSWSVSVVSLRWTTDGGQTFSPAIPVDLAAGEVDDFAFSDSGMVVTSRTEFPEYPYLTTWFLTAPRPNGPFATRQRLNPSCRETFSADAEFDPNGTGMILSCARHNSPFPGGGAEFLTITRDHGRTWSEPDTFRALESGGHPFVRHAGSEWIAMWWDSCVSAPFSYYGLWYRFSANQGRSWYPMQQAFGENIASGWIGPIELTEDRVRMYGNVNLWNGITGRYYFQWEGQIHRDTLAPVLVNAVTMPPVLPADTTITFAVTATDDDSLWRMSVIIKPPDQSDSLILLLTRGEDGSLTGVWQVPEDSGVFRYAYRAEDMWEHVTSYPDTGWLSFVTEPNAVTAHGLLPITLSLSVYPNPFNSLTTISFSMPHAGQAMVQVFDIMGKLVRVLSSGRVSAGEHRITLDGGTLASGIYFVRVAAAGDFRTSKIVFIR
jgi:hypothetical protein